MPLRIKNKDWGSIALGMDILSLSGVYSENRKILCYGRSIGENTWVGFSAKQLSVEYESDEYTAINPVFDAGTGKSAMAFDMGIIFRRNNLDLALSAQNANEPDVGIKYENKVDRKITFGVSVQGEDSVKNFDLSLVGSDTRIKLGGEMRVLRSLLKDHFLARGGLNIGSRSYRNIALGFGYQNSMRKKGIYEISYSFVYPLSGIEGTSGSHQFGLTLAWGKVSQAKEKKPEEEEKVEAKEAVGKEGYAEITLEDKNRAQRFLNQAGKYIRNGLYSKALDKFKAADKILKIDSKVKEAVNKMMTIVMLMPQNTSRARKDYFIRKAISAYMSNKPEAVLFITYAYQKWPRARALKNLYKLIVKAYPDFAFNLIPGVSIVDQMLQDALNLIQNRQFIQAISKLRDVLKLEPNNTVALTRIGSAYWAIDKKDIAKQIWKRVLQLDPENTEVKEFINLK